MIDFVFDMDGTIVDSYAAVREAYKRAGLVLPDDAWGKPAHEWGCTSHVHKMKSSLYPMILLRLGRRLHAADLLHMTNGSVLTGSSEAGVNAVKKFLKHGFEVSGFACSAEDKLTILDKKAHKARVFYVDDDLDFGKRALQEIDNMVFIHTARHEGVYHVYSKEGKVQRWTLSSWLPDVTIV